MPWQAEDGAAVLTVLAIVLIGVGIGIANGVGWGIAATGMALFVGVRY